MKYLFVLLTTLSTYACGNYPKSTPTEADTMTATGELPRPDFTPDFTATGSEPGWRLDVSWTEGARLTTQEGKLDRTVPLSTGTRAADAELIRYRTETERGALTFTLQPQPCTDASGKNYTHRVMVMVESKNGGQPQNWTGCGSYVAEQPLAGNWVLREFPGHQLPGKDTPVTINFDFAEGRVSGYNGCNQYFGTFSGGINQLSFGPLAGTKRFCGDSDIEQPFMALLGADNLSVQLLGDELTLRTGGDRLVFVPASGM